MNTWVTTPTSFPFCKIGLPDIPCTIPPVCSMRRGSVTQKTIPFGGGPAFPIGTFDFDLKTLYLPTLYYGEDLRRPFHDFAHPSQGSEGGTGDLLCQTIQDAEHAEIRVFRYVTDLFPFGKDRPNGPRLPFFSTFYGNHGRQRDAPAAGDDGFPRILV